MLPKPFFCTRYIILGNYAKKGRVQHAKKILSDLKGKIKENVLCISDLYYYTEGEIILYVPQVVVIFYINLLYKMCNYFLDRQYEARHCPFYIPGFWF